MKLEWTNYAYGEYWAKTDKGRYGIIDGDYLSFTPNDGKTPDPFDYGVEYLGKFDDPKAAAQRHADTGSVEEQTDERRDKEDAGACVP